MILTCPECATGYFVEDGQIRAAGRAVRCAACGHRWTAYPERPLDLVSSEAQGAIATRPAPEPEAEPAPLTGEDLPRVFRDRAVEEKRMREAALKGAVWGGAALAVAVAVGLALVFREGVVRAWPQTASIYAAIGLPVNITGLVIEQVRAEPSLQDGHATLAVSGVIRNITDHPVLAPPLRISLFNAQGKRVAGQIAELGNARVPPGETRHFVTSIFDPPFSAVNGGSLQVDFGLGAATTAAHMAPVQAPAAPPATPSFSLRGADASNDAVSDNAAISGFHMPPEPASAPASANAATQ